MILWSAREPHPQPFSGA